MVVQYKKYILLMLVFITGKPVMAQINIQEKNRSGCNSGAARMDLYLSELKGKNVGIVANQTSQIAGVHLVDTLMSLNIRIIKVFAPEHGFRGQADAGEKINSSNDTKTGLPIVSLYGEHTKPSDADLEGLDVLLYDIQDVGVRFYTYISTLQYVMEACALKKLHLIVLDRPNPNGYYVDGPVLEKKYKSFVGLQPIPLVYGLTAAEYADMLNGEHWLKDSLHCNLSHVLVDGYRHEDFCELPVKPSPNLPNPQTIYLYPSLGLFEGTTLSIGRGTDKPFQVIGVPKSHLGDFTFTPHSIPGAAKKPPFENEVCKGLDLSAIDKTTLRSYKQIQIGWLIDFYKASKNKKKFFNSYFNTLSGTATLKQQIIDGVSIEDIRASWQPALNAYKATRQKYLLYPDFQP
jgi:uncharacterized protein YbbC (DUF1343 family)